MLDRNGRNTQSVYRWTLGPAALGSNLRHKIIGMTLATAVMFGVAAKADTVVPLVTPNTTITLTNATGKTVTGNANFNGTGSNGTGTETVPYSIPAFGEINVANPVTVGPNLGHYPHAQIIPNIDSSTGVQYADPITHVFDCDSGNGHNVPTWNSAERQSTQPLAGTLQTGTEVLAVVSGDQPCTYSIKVYGPNGEGPLVSTTVHFGPNTSTTDHVNDLIGSVQGFNSSIEVIFDGPTGANGRAALVYTDAASLDTRVTEMKKYTPTQQPADAVAKAYVQKWLPPSDTGFYLNNKEIRALINGDSHGTPSYSTQLAQILVNSSGANGQTADQLNQWLKDQTDGNLANGEFYRAADPLSYNNSTHGTTGIGFIEEPDASWAAYPLTSTHVLPTYSLVKDQFLWRYVMDNPDQYGGNSTTGPDMNFNPTWNTQDPNQ